MFKSLHSKIVGSVFIAGTILIFTVYTVLYFINIEKSKNFNQRKIDTIARAIKDQNIKEKDLLLFFKNI